VTKEELLTKARQAVDSAHWLLHEREDIDGACNRAYYAMFNAAQTFVAYIQSTFMAKR